MVAKLLLCPCCSIFFLFFHMFAALHHWHSSHQHPKYVHTGLKMNLKWNSGDVMHFVKSRSAEEFPLFLGCSHVVWPTGHSSHGLHEHQAVMHIKTAFFDSFTNITLPNTKSNKLSLLSVSHLQEAISWLDLTENLRTDVKNSSSATRSHTWRQILLRHPFSSRLDHHLQNGSHVVLEKSSN